MPDYSTVTMQVLHRPLTNQSFLSFNGHSPEQIATGDHIMSYFLLITYLCIYTENRYRTDLRPRYGYE